jgi:hypothetical protein
MLEYEFSSMGLGTTLSFLSVLADAQQPVLIKTNRSDNALHHLKRIFDLQWLSIEIQDQLLWDLAQDPEGIRDSCKFYSPYLPVDKIIVFEKTWAINNKSKPCIGLATWDLQQEFSHHSWPYNRLYPVDVWSKIYQLCVRSGYDVISLNSVNIDLDQKIWMLNELCDCVIGYEGGIVHLAHVLQIPTVILPWRNALNAGEVISENELFLMPQKLHLDPKTYFPRGVDELLNFTAGDLKSKIVQLRNNQGNSQCLGDMDAKPIHLTKFEKNFIQTFVKSRSPGGV